MSKKNKKHALRVPITVAGGIRSQAGRGNRARHWWGQRWITLLETLMPGPRLGRGRSYAASGQVTELQLGAGVVSAKVQGANPQPYQIEIRFRTLDDAGRLNLLATMHQQPMLAARLLVREMPPELEKIFQAEGCPLFPECSEDLVMDCSCPDWTSLCKHAAAVCFLLAEAIDRDPLLLLALRGLGREELLGGRVDAKTKGAESPVDFGPAPVCSDAAPLVRRLGPLPFWRGEEKFLDVLHTVYSRATPRGWAVWNAEPLEIRRFPDERTPAASFRTPRGRLHMDLSSR